MTPPSSRLRHLAAAALTVLTLTSCGFHLRGPQPLAFATLYVSANQYSDLGTALRRQVTLSGSTKVEENEAMADARLQILTNERSREILSLNASGKVREYELGQRIRFRVLSKTNEELIPPTNLTARREYTFNDEQILGKEQEEALLYRDMETDLIQQLMRRLAAWQRP
ncbi:LPS-assembly lipoprotein LptE [Betaproteobacteria bacterium]|nr:LPS-assembly lipoprotein LptE [Betaproteobacteria bacterium]GHU22668.1 LPS-assembly lipoprotein LptE [Betaproteobacteria bacterium]